MLKKTRQEKIIKLLNLKGVIEVKDIVENCNISENTARRDLKTLDEEGVLTRTHGGAVQQKPQINLTDFNKRLSFKTNEKDQVGKLAASLINDNDILFIDCGTTLYSIVKHIRNKKSLIVISNSLPVIFELSSYPEIKTVILGGEIDKERKAIYGPVTENNVAKYHATKAFIGCDGVSIDKGLSSNEIKESAITIKMIENSDEVFLVLIAEKIEKDAYIKIAPINVVDHILTNDNVPPEVARKYKKKIDFLTA